MNADREFCNSDSHILWVLLSEFQGTFQLQETDSLKFWRKQKWRKLTKPAESGYE